MPDPEVQILRELLASDSGFVSGTHLARTLGVSRVAVWGHMERLRAAGFAFEAVRRRGYRLTARPVGLDGRLVRAYLPHRLPLAIHCLALTDSTNAEAERRLAAGQPAPFAVLATEQTAGRGRFGRPWASAPGGIHLSVAFRPDLPPDALQNFTLWMGLNVCGCVANFCRVAPQLKWPNDLYFSGRKLGGMLTEARVDADRTRDLVFGLGLNANVDPARWPPDVAARATSLAAISGAAVDPSHLTAALLGRIAAAYDRFLDGSYLSGFAEAWRAHDCLAGRTVTVVHAGETIVGTADGIDADGALLVRTGGHHVRRFRAGDVTLGRPGT